LWKDAGKARLSIFPERAQDGGGALPYTQHMPAIGPAEIVGSRDMTDRGTRLIVIAAMLTGVAFAQAGRAESITARVSYRTAEVQTRSGAEAVLARIESAAQRVCPRGLSIHEFRENKACRKDLTRQMVAKIDNRLVTALWSRRQDVQLAGRSQ
jgi:UrcA family protein